MQLPASSARGFAAMDPCQRAKIASLGGKAAHKKGTAHQFDSAEGRAAGTKGGTKISKDRQHMRKIGSCGGLARHHRAIEKLHSGKN